MIVYNFVEAYAKYLVPPKTSLTARAIDAMDDEPQRATVREALLKYFDTDTIWYVIRFIFNTHSFIYISLL